jgi:subtilisin family serine protease
VAQKKKGRKTARSKETLVPPPDSGAEIPPDQLPPEQQDERRQSLADEAKQIAGDEGERRKELRFNMLRSVVTEPLLSKVHEKRTGCYEIIIALNEFYTGGIGAALAVVEMIAKDWKVKYTTVSHYVFACLSGEQILWLADQTHQQIEAAIANKQDPRAAPTIYRIWDDNEVHLTLTRSLTTVKADAAQRAFQAWGDGITWAVLDSGIQGDHPHFKRAESRFGPIDTLNISLPVEHMDFTPDGKSNPAEKRALVDRLGHGTHVAGIIAGYWESADPAGEIVVGSEMRNEQSEDKAVRRRESLRAISGVAPKCKLVSMKVIADLTLDGEVKQTAGQGIVSWILLAIDQIQRWNQYGKRLLIQGVNMSVGYDFDPRWFGCGQSPLCVEVDRLVKSGVAVVVSAGNAGYTSFLVRGGKLMSQYSDLTITDPGNAEFAITVGSTHKEMPHRYGVSYFSSRGPTGDGRLKPDLLAPGERIVSCAAGDEAAKYGQDPGNPPVLYCEQSGTSMAAPHVCGAIAAFLSVRTEFVGQPERVKEIFAQAAIDLKRDRCFQGAGLLDLMKALQAV